MRTAARTAIRRGILARFARVGRRKKRRSSHRRSKPARRVGVSTFYVRTYTARTAAYLCAFRCPWGRRIGHEVVPGAQFPPLALRQNPIQVVLTRVREGDLGRGTAERGRGALRE